MESEYGLSPSVEGASEWTHHGGLAAAPAERADRLCRAELEATPGMELARQCDTTMYLAGLDEANACPCAHLSEWRTCRLDVEPWMAVAEGLLPPNKRTLKILWEFQEQHPEFPEDLPRTFRAWLKRRNLRKNYASYVITAYDGRIPFEIEGKVVQKWSSWRTVGGRGDHLPGLVHEPGGKKRLSCLYPDGEEVLWQIDRRLLEVGIDHLSPASMAGVLDQWIQYYAVAAHRPYWVGSCYNLSPDTIWRAYMQGIPAGVVHSLTCLPAERGDRPALPVGGKFLRKLRRMAECQRWIWEETPGLCRDAAETLDVELSHVWTSQSICVAISPKAQVFLCRMGSVEGRALLRRIIGDIIVARYDGVITPAQITLSMVRGYL
jgi:hypothetical protein